MSGSDRQFSVDPDFIVCDDPVSALVVPIQAQVVNTIRKLQEEFGATFLIISHGHSIMRYIADYIAVMYLEQLVKMADKEELFENSQYPHTEALHHSIPIPDSRAARSAGERAVLQRALPSPSDPPSGCKFHGRCPELIPSERYEFVDGV